jgi:hypothetical protein
MTDLKEPSNVTQSALLDNTHTLNPFLTLYDNRLSLSPGLVTYMPYLITNPYS